MAQLVEQVVSDVLECPDCLGSGVRIEERERVQCSSCGGRGHISKFKPFKYEPRRLPFRKPQKCPCCGKPME